LVLCPLPIDSRAGIAVVILPLMVVPRAVVVIAILPLTLVPSALHLLRAFDPSPFDPRLLYASPLDSRLLDPSALSALTFPALSFQPLALDPRSDLPISFLLTPKCDLTIAVAAITAIVHVVHSARRPLISPDDTSVARNVGLSDGTARRSGLPSWRHAVDPDTT